MDINKTISFLLKYGCLLSFPEAYKNILSGKFIYSSDSINFLFLNSFIYYFYNFKEEEEKNRLKGRLIRFERVSREILGGSNENEIAIQMLLLNQIKKFKEALNNSEINIEKIKESISKNGIKCINKVDTPQEVAFIADCVYFLTFSKAIDSMIIMFNIFVEGILYKEITAVVRIVKDIFSDVDFNIFKDFDNEFDEYIKGTKVSSKYELYNTQFSENNFDDGTEIDDFSVSNILKKYGKFLSLDKEGDDLLPLFIIRVIKSYQILYKKDNDLFVSKIEEEFFNNFVQDIIDISGSNDIEDVTLINNLICHIKGLQNSYDCFEDFEIEEIADESLDWESLVQIEEIDKMIFALDALAFRSFKMFIDRNIFAWKKQTVYMELLEALDNCKKFNKFFSSYPLIQYVPLFTKATKDDIILRVRFFREKGEITFPRIIIDRSQIE